MNGQKNEVVSKSEGGPKSEGGRHASAAPGKRKHHNPEQVIIRLREVDADLAAGLTIEEIARKHAVSVVTIGRWREKYGGMKGPDMKRLKDLEVQNERLKRAVADLTLDNQMLKEVAKGEF